MRRFFIELAYNGTRFCGWQRQPNAPSVAQTIEEKMQLLLRKPIEIVGCGRTDSGVHAQQYFAHFDIEAPLFDPQYFLFRLNKMVGADIHLRKIIEVNTAQHARFAAISRSYEYHISFEKNIFETETTWFVTHRDRLNTDLMQQAAQILLDFKEFAPFCKTNSDAQTMFCELTESRWDFSEQRAVFHISANRFLRGMVRLIVGACMNVGEGQLSLQQLRHALETQSPLPKNYSVPPNGLFLTNIKYPFIEKSKK